MNNFHEVDSTLLGMYFHLQDNCKSDERVIVIDGVPEIAKKPYIALLREKLVQGMLRHGSGAVSRLKGAVRAKRRIKTTNKEV